MSRVHILGGTGYAGEHIAREADKRDHKVVSFSRKLPAKGISKITYKTGDVLDDAFLASVFDGADVVISALSPRGSLESPGNLRAVLRQAASIAGDRGIRFGVIGGAGSLFTEPGGPRFVDTPEFPAFAKPEALVMAAVLEDLKTTPQSLDWFFVSPAGQFGAHAPGEATGRYRIGEDVLLRDENGHSAISGADFAVAVVAELETPAHYRRRFTVAY